MEEFGDRLKELIQEKTTIGDFSNSIAVNQSMVYEWLRNESTPKHDNLIKTADYFRVSIDYLAGKSINFAEGNFKQCPPFNERLKEIIGESKFSKYKICKDTKISKTSLKQWLNGKEKPLINNLITLADYFDCTIDYLVGRE